MQHCTGVLLRPGFWETVPLNQMSSGEWEALCDGCGKCCLHKLQDEESEQLYYTRVACRLLDLETCRCSDYARRQQRVRECLVLSPAALGRVDYLPDTCAYRLLADGRALPEWHYLRSKDRSTVRQAGASVGEWAVSAEYVHEDELEEHIIQWVE